MMDPHGDHYHQQPQGFPPPPPPTHLNQAPQSRPLNSLQPYQQPLSPTSGRSDQHSLPHWQERQYHQPQQPQQQQQQQAQHKPQSSQSSSARSRGFSFHSDRGRKNSHDKVDLHETHAEKEAKRLHSKADPTLAISEAEPSEVAAMTETSLAPLRSIVHKDATGNPIVDPDKSNPTRSRWERPLDTIRSFEAAVDGAYHRKSLIRADTDSAANWNRRGSQQQGPGMHHRARPDSFYGSRPVSMMRFDSQYEHNGAGTARNSIYEGHGYSHGHNSYNHGYNSQGVTPNHNGGRQRPNRQYSEASNHNAYGRDQHGYQLSHKDRSYETVASAAASGGSDPVGYQTDPTSSDNSSIERRSPHKRPEPVNDYGIGFSQSNNGPHSNLGVGLVQKDHHPLPSPSATGAYHPGQAAPATIPRKEPPSVLRRQPTQQSTAAPEKRKSWFSRRFSKNP